MSFNWILLAGLICFRLDRLYSFFISLLHGNQLPVILTFEFYRLQNQSFFLLAVWYGLVWTANGHSSVSKVSRVELTKNGQLILKNLQGQVIWKAGSTSTEVAYAAVLDTCNLVLGNKNSSYILESFKNSTDTANSSIENRSDSIFKLDVRF